jgi:hypothetical protein
MAGSESQQSGTDYVDTTAGGERAPSTHSMGDTPGSGANELTRAGLPNADPDGYDEARSDLEGVTLDHIPPARGSDAPSPAPIAATAQRPTTYPDETRQRNDVAAPTAATASHDGERSAGSGPGQGEFGGDGFSAQGDFAGKGGTGLNDEEREVARRATEQARQNNPGLGIQNRQD